MPPRFCCCRDCDLFDDNFDRADGDPGSNWDGSGVIASNVLDSNEDTVTVCHPSWATLGSLYGYCTMIDCDPALVHKVRVGDPTGDYEIWVTFAGTVGSGTMTITVKNGIDADVEHEYPWEDADEYLQICYEPGVQISAGPSSRDTGEHPDWVTSCIPLDPHDNCWPGDLGNWTFVQGKFDTFHFEVHWHELSTCEDCDCSCWYIDPDTNEKIIECIPDTLCISVTSEDCPDFMDGTFTMYQRRVIDSPLPYDVYPTLEDWTQKFTWVSESIPCPYTGFEFYFVLTCGYNTSDDTKPKFRLAVARYAPGMPPPLTTFQFDTSDPNSSTPAPYSNESFALVELTSTCNPFYLEFPTIIESGWQSSDPGNSCCGGSVYSDQPEPSPDSHFTVIITECA